MKLEDETKCFVKYNSNLFCHIYSEVRKIEPIEWIGCQGWRKVDKSFISKIKLI